MRRLTLALAVAGALLTLAGPHGAVAQTQPAAAAAPAASGPARAPLDLFVGYDNFRSPDISPNGRYVAAIHREAAGDVLIVLDTQTNHISQLQLARADQQQSLMFVQFKSDSRLVFGLEQKVHVVADRRTTNIRLEPDHYEFNWRIYAVNIDGSSMLQLYDPSSQQGLPRFINAGIADLLDNDPNNVMLIAPNYGGAELWKVNVNTGEHTVVESGDAETFNWVLDSQGTPVLRQEIIASGRGFAWERRAPGQREWTEVVRFRGAEGANSGPTFQGVGPALQPGQVFVLARRDGDDTSGLFVYDTATGNYVQSIETNEHFDVSNAIRDVHHNSILAACWWGERWTCDAKDADFGRRWTAVTHALGPNVSVHYLGRGGEGGSRWLLQTDGPQDLGSFYLYDASAHTMNLLFGARPVVDPALLPTERVVHYQASDGMDLWGYLWVPPGVTDVKNLPTVVVPHGGPEGRDVYGFDPFAIVLASHGYAVFQPNFRGGGGSGRRFVQAGWRQWGQRMQEDVSDGARYLIAQGIADRNRMCIMGWSYGGYVAMTASFENADIYKCSVAGAGISDQAAMMRWTRDGDAYIPNGIRRTEGSGTESMSYKYWADAMGNLGADSAMMDAHSAALNAARVGMPLLLIHGDQDITVPIAQSQEMVQAMQRAGKPVRLVTLPATEHHYTPDQAESWRTVFTESLAFIGQNIGPGVAPGSQ
ncbi:MAG: prolyl oligopeptidase family serine peptidase [Terricaulis sp.]